MYYIKNVYIVGAEEIYFSKENEPFVYLNKKLISGLLIHKEGLKELAIKPDTNFKFIKDEKSGWMYYYTRK